MVLRNNINGSNNNIPVSIATYFYNLILDTQSSTHADSLAIYDKQMHQQLQYVLACDPEDVVDLDLYFEITFDRYGIKETIPLIPHGENIQVTWRNRKQYVELVAQQYYSRIKEQVYLKL